MKPNEVILPTEEEVRAAYREGENVVVSLFEQIAVTMTQLAERGTGIGRSAGKE